MELAFGGVLVTIFLAGFGYLATGIKGVRENMNAGFSELRGDVKTLTGRYIAHLERHR